MLRVSCLKLEINEVRCYEAQIEESEKGHTLLYLRLINHSAWVLSWRREFTIGMLLPLISHEWLQLPMGKVLLCSVHVVAQWLCHVLACITLYFIIAWLLSNYRYTVWTLACGLDSTCRYDNCVIGNHHILFFNLVDSGSSGVWHLFNTVLPERSTK